MSQTLPRQGAPATVGGRKIFNAYCIWCDALDVGTLSDLLERGWQGDFRCCVEHRSYDQPIAPPPAVRVLTDPFPGWVHDRGHWGERDDGTPWPMHFEAGP